MTDAAQMQNPAPLERELGYSRHDEFIPPLPQNAQRIMRVRDLPTARDYATFTVESETGAATAVIGKRERQVLEALLAGPIFCASPVRLSDTILHLRGKLGDGAIVTIMHERRDRETGVSRFGLYDLAAKVRRASE
jgi:hypothetical protein